MLVIPNPSRSLTHYLRSRGPWRHLGTLFHNSAPLPGHQVWERMMGLALQCRVQPLLPRREMGGRPRGRRGGELGRRGNGLATNCTITTFRKRKNHSVLFLHTICFPLLPPTLQFRGREERPLLGGCPAGGSRLGTESGKPLLPEARGRFREVGEGL